MVDPEKLKAILPHLQYECHQLNASAGLLGAWRSIKDTLPRGVWSALVESFAVHARNLIEFLHRRRNARYEQSDVRAIDFVPGWEVKEHFMQTHYERANKQINHLTYDRTDSAANFDWPYVQIAAELLAELQKLQQAASSDSPLKELDLFRDTKPSALSPYAATTGLQEILSATARTTGVTDHKTSASTPSVFQGYGKTE